MAETLYKITDYTAKYEPIMKFNKNKNEFIHKWYPFVEGYSKEFITSILEELDYAPQCCLEPFMGSGTTPVELQLQEIKCISFEVSPFMYLLARVKMRIDYTYSGFLKYFHEVKTLLNNTPQDIESIIEKPKLNTITENGKLKKWLFHKEELKAILDVKHAIKKIPDRKYRDLFSIALSSILLEISNVYRNGKCLSYKENWETNKRTRNEIHKLFTDKLTTVFKRDIGEIDINNNVLDFKFSNYENAIYGDVRKELTKISDDTIDLVITSPPYLNSRDYTDIYMVELWVLDLIKSYPTLMELRKRTIRSHVQVKHGTIEKLEIPLLTNALKELEEFKEDYWNSELPNMILGYFRDMDTLFGILNKKMIPKKKIFFNVANSAYYGVEIRVDEIVAEIAHKHGFKILEIRKARELRVSSQQKNKIKSLRESVIVMLS